MRPWHEQLLNVIRVRQQWPTTSVRQETAVVSQVRRSRSSKRLIYQRRNLEQHALTDWQPMQLPQHWCDVVTPTGACDQAGAAFCTDCKR